MCLSLLPRVLLLLGLLLLILMLVTVFGIPMEMHQGPGHLSKKTPMNIEGNVETGNDKPKGKAINGSTPVSSNSLNSSTKCRCHKQDEDGAKNSRMSSIPDPINLDKDDLNRCEKWLNPSQNLFIYYLKLTLQKLLSCPCSYPEEALNGVATFFDQRLNHMIRWANAINAEKYVLAYHPTVKVCLRSLQEKSMDILGAQLCSSNHRHKLLTQGKGAGSPEFISPYVSPDLHFTLNRFPWIICQGNWRLFHSVLPPDNGHSCQKRPHTIEA